MFEIWYNVLINPEKVWVFEHDGELVWTDRFAFARVPPPLVDRVEPGPYRVTIRSAERINNFPLKNIEESIEKADAKCRIKVDNEIESLPTKIFETQNWETPDKLKAVTAYEYHTLKRRDPIYIRDKIHTILLSSVRRGASLFTDTKRYSIAAKMDDKVVAWVAVINPGTSYPY